MRSVSEYHDPVFPVMQSGKIHLTRLAAICVLGLTSYAQINGAPTSVTSPGFGGRAVNGAPSSVTSLGPRGYALGPQIVFSAPLLPDRNRDAGRHHRHSKVEGWPFLYAVPVPYAVSSDALDNADEPESDAPYENESTFNRHGSSSRSYVAPANDYSPPSAKEPVRDQDPDAASDPTLLVFRDGHKLEVSNYAIVGATLFDLTPGHSRKIALADLDLVATREQNDDRGVVFRLPLSLQTN